MAKGLRSKVKTRYRTIKRLHVDEVVERPNIEKLNKRIKSQVQDQNAYSDLIRPPNKFLHPENVKAVIPKHRLIKKIDFRPEALPISGLATIGNRRKYSNDEKIEIKNSYGYNSNLIPNIDINKIVEDMHNRSKQAMRYLKEMNTHNQKVEN